MLQWIKIHGIDIKTITHHHQSFHNSPPMSYISLSLVIASISPSLLGKRFYITISRACRSSILYVLIFTILHEWDYLSFVVTPLTIVLKHDILQFYPYCRKMNDLLLLHSISLRICIITFESIYRQLDIRDLFIIIITFSSCNYIK